MLPIDCPAWDYEDHPGRRPVLRRELLAFLQKLDREPPPIEAAADHYPQQSPLDTAALTR